jgi:Bacteriodetes cell division protein (FtsL-like)
LAYYQRPPLLLVMDKNTYKSRKKKGLFTYLEHTIHFKDLSFHGLPGRYIPRLLFLFLMSIFYVGNTHYHEKMARKIGQLEREVDALRVDYTTLQADYMFDSKQSEVAKRVARMGLYDPPDPPSRIKLK